MELSQGAAVIATDPPIYEIGKGLTRNGSTHTFSRRSPRHGEELEGATRGGTKRTMAREITVQLRYYLPFVDRPLFKDLLSTNRTGRKLTSAVLIRKTGADFSKLTKYAVSRACKFYSTSKCIVGKWNFHMTQQRTIFSDEIPFVALRESTTSLDSFTIAG